MGLRIINIESDETYNYCNILNITKAILGVTSKIHYSNIECIDQTRDNMCKNMKDLFENSYVIPIPQYVNIANILEKSIMNILECNSDKINKFKQSITYFNYEIIPLFILGIIVYYFIKKHKKTN